MIEVFVTVNYKDKNYQTNVIVNKEKWHGKKLNSCIPKFLYS